MSISRPLVLMLYLAGRPWTVWVVGIALIFVNRAAGASGLDAVVLAAGPAILYGGFSWVCRALTRNIGDPFVRSILPANRPLPKPQLAVIVAPDRVAEACPASPGMVEQLPEPLRRLVAPDAG